MHGNVVRERTKAEHLVVGRESTIRGIIATILETPLERQAGSSRLDATPSAIDAIVRRRRNLCATILRKVEVNIGQAPRCFM